MIVLVNRSNFVIWLGFSRFWRHINILILSSSCVSTEEDDTLQLLQKGWRSMKTHSLPKAHVCRDHVCHWHLKMIHISHAFKLKKQSVFDSLFSEHREGISHIKQKNTHRYWLAAHQTGVRPNANRSVWVISNPSISVTGHRELFHVTLAEHH